MGNTKAREKVRRAASRDGGPPPGQEAHKSKYGPEAESAHTAEQNGGKTNESAGNHHSSDGK